MFAVSAHAGVPIPEPPLPQRVALADAIILGKVTELEETLIDAAPLPKSPRGRKLPHRIAIVQVAESVRGVKEQAQLRVGFISLSPDTQAPGVRRLAQVKLAVSQQGCFFLHRHPDETFYVVGSPTDVIDPAKAKNFEKDQTLIRRCARLLDNPNAGLACSDAESRWLTAAMLVFQYRTPTIVYRGPPRMQPVDVEQSRLILTDLTDGPWTEEALRSQMSPVRLFLRLGLTAKDGWLPPESLDEVPASIKKWIAEHAATCRIQRYALPETP
jgi:hypothetical protein